MKVEVRKSKIRGSGVFLTEPVKKDKKIFRFSDNLIRIVHWPGCHCKICCRCINLKMNYWLYPKDSPFGWNLNHSCNPSAYSKGRDIFALRNLGAEEEVTIDYSTTNVDRKWKMKCNCQAKHCRKIIRSVQFLPKDIFSRFMGKMPRFIEASYNPEA